MGCTKSKARLSSEVAEPARPAKQQKFGSKEELGSSEEHAANGGPGQVHVDLPSSPWQEVEEISHSSSPRDGSCALADSKVPLSDKVAVGPLLQGDSPLRDVVESTSVELHQSHATETLPPNVPLREHASCGMDEHPMDLDSRPMDVTHHHEEEHRVVEAEGMDEQQVLQLHDAQLGDSRVVSVPELLPRASSSSQRICCDDVEAIACAPTCGSRYPSSAIGPPSRICQKRREEKPNEVATKMGENRSDDRPKKNGKALRRGTANHRSDTAPPPKIRLQRPNFSEPPAPLDVAPSAAASTAGAATSEVQNSLMPSPSDDKVNSTPPPRICLQRLIFNDYCGADCESIRSLPLSVSEISKAEAADVGETWPEFLERNSLPVKDAGCSPASLFETFRTSADLAVIYSAFGHLFNIAAQPHKETNQPRPAETATPPWPETPAGPHRPPWQFPYEPIRVLLGGNWKAKRLWDSMDALTSCSDYEAGPCAGGRLAGRRAVVVGAGPAGLRAAVELRLLGSSVTVVEKRTAFSRINQLHLWNWCGEDIKRLGARLMEPPSKDFGSNPDLLHIGIAELQTLLLKTALLLGVHVLLGSEFVGVAPGPDGEPCVRLGNDSTRAHSSCPSPMAPAVLREVAVLVGSDGLGCRVGQNLGMGVVETSGLRSEEAIGLVCNFLPIPSCALERELRSFAMARQFYNQLFRELGSSTGVQLENIVYTKAKNSHYFVMTPTRKCLVDSGVIRNASHKPLLARDNINTAALDSFVRAVVAFKFKAGEPCLADVAASGAVAQEHVEPSAALAYADGGPQLFDFSKLQRAEEGISFIECGSGAPMLVALVGDALLEPFWPEGLGVVRGFFSALDVSSAVARWAGGASPLQVRRHFSDAFSQLKSLCGHNRGSVLRSDERAYRLAPCSRYRHVVDDP